MEYSSDKNKKHNVRWINYGQCDKKMHVHCVPKKYLQETNFELDDNEDIDFAYEFCNEAAWLTPVISATSWS